MSFIRTAVVAVSAALAVALVGCSPDDSPTPPPSQTPPTTVDAVAILADAVTKTIAVDHRYSVDADGVVTTYDPASGIAVTVAAGADQLTVTTDGSTLYLAGPTDFQGLTFQLQSSRLTATSPFALFADPFPPATLLSGVATATASSDASFEGSINLTTATASSDGAAAFLAYLVATAAERASDVKFKAEVAGGYLVKLQVTLPYLDDGADAVYLMELSEFGTDVANAFPTGAGVIEAPDELYEA
jgi:hypothetical protein